MPRHWWKLDQKKEGRVKRNTCQVNQNPKSIKLFEQWLSCKRKCWTYQPSLQQGFSPWAALLHPKALEMPQSPLPRVSVSVLCSRRAQPLHSPWGQKRSPLGCAMAAESLEGIPQFSVFSLIPAVLGLYPKRLQGTEGSGWGEVLGFGLERRNSVCSSSFEHRKFLYCAFRSPGPSKDPTRAAAVGKGQWE